MEMCGGGSNGCLFITICACQITYRKSAMDTVQLRQMGHCSGDRTCKTNDWHRR